MLFRSGHPPPNPLSMERKRAGHLLYHSLIAVGFPPCMLFSIRARRITGRSSDSPDFRYYQRTSGNVKQPQSSDWPITGRLKIGRSVSTNVVVGQESRVLLFFSTSRAGRCAGLLLESPMDQCSVQCISVFGEPFSAMRFRSDALDRGASTVGEFGAR